LKQLHIGIIDLVHNAPTRDLYQRLINSSVMSIMPQVIGAWCRQMGHRVDYVLYGGLTNLMKQIPDDLDMVFINAFTFTAQLAYSISSMLRSRGSVTVLGGPHARCYPEDSSLYFDYVIGLLDKDLLCDILKDCNRYHPRGTFLSSGNQPRTLPPVEERWEFIEKGFCQRSIIKLVPMISSFGCPYQCDFCIDSTIPYQPLEPDFLKQDLRFILRKFRHPRIGWYDPNFGVRFSSIMSVIEECVPPGRADFIAECNLSVLTEPNVRRMMKNGFASVMPGIESWYDYGQKAGTGNAKGLEKVKQVSAQLNMVQGHIPYVNVNFIMGLDSDQGREPFELTKKFIHMTPGVYPAFLLFSVFGRAAPGNRKYQEENRIIPIPFHMHRSTHFINIKPRNYTWPEFYGYLIDLLNYSFSGMALYRRFMKMKSRIPRWLILAQSVSSGGYGKISNHSRILEKLQHNRQFRQFFEKETTEIPEFFKTKIKQDLGPIFWSWLPEGALEHDPNAYLNNPH
jgi:radical SAM superfamily enzyme YgiQ (UPF0313 family)